jgi:hypothetical protein
VSRTSDAHRALREALVALLTPVTVLSSSDKPWASATFSGARHRFQLALAGNGAASKADRFASALANQDFDLSGHLVADISVCAISSSPGRSEIQIEALTVEAV